MRHNCSLIKSQNTPHLAQEIKSSCQMSTLILNTWHMTLQVFRLICAVVTSLLTEKGNKWNFFHYFRPRGLFVLQLQRDIRGREIRIHDQFDILIIETCYTTRMENNSNAATISESEMERILGKEVAVARALDVERSEFIVCFINSIVNKSVSTLLQGFHEIWLLFILHFELLTEK